MSQLKPHEIMKQIINDIFPPIAQWENDIEIGATVHSQEFLNELQSESDIIAQTLNELCPNLAPDLTQEQIDKQNQEQIDKRKSRLAEHKLRIRNESCRMSNTWHYGQHLLSEHLKTGKALKTLN